MAGALTSKSLLEELLRVSSSRCREQNLLEGMLPAWSLRSFYTSGRDWAALRLASTLQSLLKELVRAAAHFRVAGGVYGAFWRSYCTFRKAGASRKASAFVWQAQEELVCA